MVKPEGVLALIPARGGSKSLPRKNIHPFAGHPLVAYSVAAGLQAELVDRVIVSTDDEEIAQISRSYSAEVPFIRPGTIAQDDTPDLPVFLHALSWLKEEEGYQPEYVVQLRPTSPVRPIGLVDQALKILFDHPEADSVRGVVPAGQNPYKMWKMDAKGQLVPLLKTDLEEPYNMPRQQLPSTYWQTGHIDAIRSETILKKDSMSGEIILPIMIDPTFSVDIDTLLDSERAERFLFGVGINFVQPGRSKRVLPEQIDLVVFDFDGVFTDNRVWLNREGEEFVAAHRGDGWGITSLLESGVKAVVLSTETDSVVKARCDKLGLPVVQGIRDKLPALKRILEDFEIPSDRTIYLGNDVNDVPCFPAIACAIVVNDAHPDAKHAADIVLSSPGGQGAVRELCDRILRNPEE